jgi:superfamily II DNA or RNA helicase
MNNTLLDNSEHYKLVDYVRQLISDTACDEIKIASGYWDLPGTSLLAKELTDFFERGGKFYLLIGKEPTIKEYQLDGTKAEDKKFPDFYIRRDINLLSDDYRPIAEMLLKYTDEEDEANSQIAIHVYGQGKEEQFLHAKCYIFLGNKYANGIIGSSNFTKNGLQNNAELNYLETQGSVVTAQPDKYNQSKSHNEWFKQMWENSEPWTGKFIREILKPSPIGQAVLRHRDVAQVPVQPDRPITPYELYIKLLQIHFGDLVDKKRSTILANYLPKKYHKLEYQLIAVKQCYSIMKTHGGFMLADVVGLGKTVVGTLLIKFFLEMPDDRVRRVLIITPPAIESSWRDTIDEFDEGIADKIKQKIDFITTGSIGNLVDGVDSSDSGDDDGDSGDFNEEFKNDNYGLIIIDESHKFRNNTTQMYKKLDRLISNIGSDTGVYPYIGLLSATPQNNTPADLRNQIYLFERNHKYCSLEKVPGYNLENYFTNVCKKFDALLTEAGKLRALIEEQPDKKPELAEINEQLIDLSQDVRDKVLADILVRRTRTDIMKFYADDVKAENIVFPQIVGPCELSYIMSDRLAQLFADTMKLICTNTSFSDPNYICYYRYQAIKFIKNEGIAKSYHYKNMTPERFSQQLAKIMQMLLVKRLESSFMAFKSSLHNLRTYTQNMIDMWVNDTIFICPDIDVNGELDVNKLRKKDKTKPILTFAQCVEDIRKKITSLNEKKKNEKGRNAEFHREDFHSDYIDKLRRDYAIINDLCERWDENVDDPKFDKFKESLLPTLLSPERNPYKKLVIFTEAKDTLNALVSACESKGLKVLAISAENRKLLEREIKANFDANYKGKWRNDYDVIITTEVLAEGINLHRANSILNYDTPWNSTRLMQRIGRVNRIGSKASHIYVYNFMPSAQGVTCKF